jgi:serine/threonine-protein kinase
VSPASCPTDDTLTAFATGHLATADLNSLADHLDACPACQARLADLDTQPEPLAQVLRRLAPDTDGTLTRVHTAWQLPAAGTGLQEETRRLLRRRLLVTGLVGGTVAVGLALLTLPGVADAVTAAAGGWGAAILVGYAAGAFALVWLLLARPGISLTALRRVELFHVAGLVTYVTHFRWAALAGGATETFTGDAHRSLFVEQAVLLSNMSWYLLIVGYGLLIPNTVRRSLIVVGGMAAVAVAATVVCGLTMEHVRDRLPTVTAVTAVGVFLTGAMAVFGSYKIRELQEQVAAARDVGPYRLVRKLGAGGMGEVWLAEHRLLKRPCAVKFVRPDHTGNPDAMRRFEREAQATATLSHPNTVEVFDYGRTAEGTFYFVMEHLNGVSLAELVRQHGPLPPARAVHFLRQLCGALREAHGVGLIHRDIKPANVMACTMGGVADVAKLLDFGLVSARGPDGRELTRTGVIMGTPEYMSPEQASGIPVDPRSDLYSLGAMAYSLLAGRPPFRSASALDVLIAHRQQPPEPLGTVVGAVPQDLETVVMKCLEKKAADRYPDASALDAALAACGCAGGWDDRRAGDWWRDHGSKPCRT